MSKAYKFIDQRPMVGTTVHAFRNIGDLKDFAKIQGPKGCFKFWEIEGAIIADDGGMDGIQIKVVNVKEVF